MGSKKTDGDDGELHFFLFPFMVQGHLKPAIDMARLFSSRGHRSTVVTTSSLARSVSESLRNDAARIEFLTVAIPCEVGLPDGTDSFHATRDDEDRQRFAEATVLLAPQLAHFLGIHRPDCLVADMFFPWAITVAASHGVPGLVFHGTSCLALCASLSVFLHRPEERVSSGSESFLIPGLPVEVAFTRDKLPDFGPRGLSSMFGRLYEDSKRVERASHGVLVNSFRELEPGFPECYTGTLGVRQAWHIGPLLLCRDREDDCVRGGDEHGCLAWLESKEPGSVVYVCFGSVASLGDAQLVEIAAGLEASGSEFLWVVGRESEWMPEGFEERTAGRGKVVRGWAPQEAILGHVAVGGFVTHCGWNSTLEAVCAGVPMATWPLAAEQFYNEFLVSRVLGVGVEVGVGTWSLTGGDLVGRDTVERVVRRVMVGEEAEVMRLRARRLAEMAMRAVGEGGSSHLDLEALFRDLMSRRASDS